jgi:DNA-binding MarR family transcriptional regulator
MAPDELTTEDVVTVAEFRSALRKFLRRSELIADTCGLTPQRYLLLLMIKGSPDGSGRSTVTELSDRLQLAQSTVTELVARSVDAGLIAREGSSSDGRVTYLQLTAEGERRLACSFSGLETERGALYEAIGSLRPSAYS